MSPAWPYLTSPVMFFVCVFAFLKIYKGTIRNCSQGARQNHTGHDWAWSGVSCCLWRGWREREQILSVKWKPFPNDSYSWNNRPGAGPSAGATYHGTCWTCEQTLFLKRKLAQDFSSTQIYWGVFIPFHPIRLAFQMLGNHLCWEPSPMLDLLWLLTLLQLSILMWA